MLFGVKRCSEWPTILGFLELRVFLRSWDFPAESGNVLDKLGYLATPAIEVLLQKVGIEGGKEEAVITLISPNTKDFVIQHHCFLDFWLCSPWGIWEEWDCTELINSKCQAFEFHFLLLSLSGIHFYSFILRSSALLWSFLAYFFF